MKLKSLFHKASAGDGDIAGRDPIDRLSDGEFVDFVYQRLLGREPEPEGRAHSLAYLRAGNSRAALVLHMTATEEFRRKSAKDNIRSYLKLLPILDERPDRYLTMTHRSGREKTMAFRAAEPEDLDWLERKILENGYYEKPGVWSFIVDEDKRMLAEMAAGFAPRLVLDLGCANGAVLRCLRDRGIEGEGVEISRMAIDQADPEIRARIHAGDLAGLHLAPRYDLVLGLDIFEHFSLGGLTAVIAEIHRVLLPGGRLLANIPAYGTDEVFGRIFPLDFAEWDEDAAAGRPFRHLPVDSYGYPRNGHLILAESTWWVGQFTRARFQREPERERDLHARHDATMDRISPARKALYVFRKKSEGL